MAAEDTSGAPSAKEGMEAPTLTFREHMWDRFDFLWQNKVEPSRKVLEEFVQSLRDRAELERQYAYGLAKATARLEATAPPDGLPEAMEAVAVNMRNRSDQSLRLAEDLESDVCEVMASMLRQHGEVSKRIFHDGRRISHQLKEARRQHQMAAAKYADACLAAEDVPDFQDMAATQVKKDERFKLCNRMLALQRQATQAEREYYQAIQNLNALTETHERQMGKVLETLQTMEEKRVRCFHDTAMKLAVYDVSWLRNMQYDLDAVVKTLENADGLRDLQEFIRQHQSERPPQLKVDPRPFWELASAPAATPAAPAAPVRPEAEARARLRVEVVEPAVQTLFVGGDLEANQEAFQQLHQGFNVAAGVPPTESQDSAPATVARAASTGASTTRSVFCAVLEEELRRKAMASNPSCTGEDLEALPPTSVPLASFEELVSLFSKALDGCDREGDCFGGRNLLAFLHLVHCNIDGKDVSILLRVYSHPLWSRVTFWEDVLMVGIFEAQALAASRRRSRDAGAKSEEVVMTTFLRRFVQFMVSFGIKFDQACNCVQKTLRKHVSNLGQPLMEGYAKELTPTASHSLVAAVAPLTEPPLPHITIAPNSLTSTAVLAPAVSAVSANGKTTAHGLEPSPALPEEPPLPHIAVAPSAITATAASVFSSSEAAVNSDASIASNAVDQQQTEQA